LRAMLAKGHEILACAGEPHADAVEILRGWGVNFAPINMSRAGMRPWEDLRAGGQLFCLIRRFQPDVVLAYTIKPVIWGGLAAKAASTAQVYSLITGLGYAFLSDNGVRGKVAGLCASLLYKLSLKNSRCVFFQNPDDMYEFMRRGIIKWEQGLLVNGSGVDLEHYDLAPLPSAPCFLMICRLLVDKGVREYVEAARVIRARCPEVRFRLAGPLDSNPASVSQTELEQWKEEGVIDYLGELEDVRPAIADSSIYVLPSYREGTPRTVLEGMSMGRPVITTNAPGCRETIKLPCGMTLDKASKEVIQGENGFLIPTRNVEKLVEAMERFIVHPELIHQMGRKSREIAEEKYDVHKVNAVMLKAMGLE
jgi:glycosyltransferase involved in cell wall biosynthesis